MEALYTKGVLKGEALGWHEPIPLCVVFLPQCMHL